MMDNPDNAPVLPSEAQDEVAPTEVPRDESGAALADEHPELGAGGVVPSDAPADQPVEEVEADAPVWVVQPNDTGLSAIVGRLYGLEVGSPENAAKVQDLLSLNSNVIGSDPEALNVGSVLTLDGNPNLPE